MGFSDFFKGLFGDVGNGRDNHQDDVKQVKRGLGRVVRQFAVDPCVL